MLNKYSFYNSYSYDTIKTKKDHHQIKRMKNFIFSVKVCDFSLLFLYF